MHEILVPFAAFFGAMAGSSLFGYFLRAHRLKKVAASAGELMHDLEGKVCSSCHALVHRFEVWDNNAIVCANCVRDKINDRAGNASLAGK
jgi:hypothetical protein